MSDQDSGDNNKRRRLEGVIPDLIKRAVELGVEKAQGAPDNLKEFVHGMKVPKEIASYILTQVDETKNGLFRVVGKEVRDFLEHTNVAGELSKLLTTVQFEVNTTIRFKPNETAEGSPSPQKAKPEVTTDVHVTRREERPASGSPAGTGKRRNRE